MTLDRERLYFIVLMTGIFLFTLGSGIFYQVLVYASLNLGATFMQIGYIQLCLALPLAIFPAIWGYSSDRIGRKPIVALCMTGAGICYILISLTNNLIMLAAIGILSAVLSAGIIPAAYSFVTGITEPGERGMWLGRLCAAGGAGILSANVLSRYIVQYSTFFLAGTACVIAAVLIYIILPGKAHLYLQRSGSMELEASGKGMITILALLIVILVGLASACYNRVQFNFITDHLHLTYPISPVPVLGSSMEMGVLELYTLAMAMSGILTIVSQGFLIAPLIRRYKEEGATLVGLITAALGVGLLFCSIDLISLLVAMSLFSIGTGIFTPCIYSAVARCTRKTWHGTAMGVAVSVSGIGAIIVPLLIGSIYGINSYLPFIISGAILCISVALILLMAWLDGKVSIKATAQES